MGFFAVTHPRAQPELGEAPVGSPGRSSRWRQGGLCMVSLALSQFVRFFLLWEFRLGSHKLAFLGFDAFCHKQDWRVQRLYSDLRPRF